MGHPPAPPVHRLLAPAGAVRQVAAVQHTPVKPLARIPFSLYMNHVCIGIRVNGSGPLRFILDSAAGDCVLNRRLAASLRLEPAGRVRTVGTGQSRGTAGIVRNVRYSLGGVAFRAARSVVLDLSPLEARAGRPIDGFIGYDLFHSYVVEIDYAGGTVALYARRTFRYQGHGGQFPITVRARLPMTHARVDVAGKPPAFGEFILDTGAESAVILSPGFVQSNKLLDKKTATISRRSNGVGGDMDEQIGRVAAIRIDKFVVEQPVTAFSQATRGVFATRDVQGSIGGEILKRFKVVFDYGRGRLVLEPNSHLKDQDDYDMCGALFVAEGQDLKTLRVSRIYPATPAAEAGLQEGDVITSVDDKPTSSLSLDAVRALFRQDGKEYTLTVLRSKETVKLKIKPRRLV